VLRIVTVTTTSSLLTRFCRAGVTSTTMPPGAAARASPISSRAASMLPVQRALPFM
jgi:hypothetical protein